MISLGHTSYCVALPADYQWEAIVLPPNQKGKARGKEPSPRVRQPSPLRAGEGTELRVPPHPRLTPRTTPFRPLGGLTIDHVGVSAEEIERI